MHVRQLTHDHFRSDRYDLFYQFLCERQRIWVRRAHLGLNRPWTTDRALNYEFITNVYRELDPGTEYVLDSLCSGDEKSNVDKVFNIMVYRLMGSQIPTHTTLGFLQHDSFSTKRFNRILGSEGNVFGNAYRVNPGDQGGTKLSNVGERIKEVASNMPEWYRRMQGSPTANDLYKVFNSISGFGTFLSNQCMVDVLMVDEAGLFGERHWGFGTDEWCEPGPGAKRGIAAMLNEGVKPANLQMVMAWLRDAQQAEWQRLNLEFPFLLNADDTPKTLTICNIQTALCEFHKYVRSRGHVKVRQYASNPSKLTPWDVSLSPEGIEALRDLTACTQDESMYSAKLISEVQEDLEIEDGSSIGQIETAIASGTLRPYLGTGVTTLPEVEHIISAQSTEPLAAAPGLATNINNPDPGFLSSVLGMLGQAGPQQKATVIPVDPTGLIPGLPKAIVIMPIY